jgi:hypothetical protein
MLGHSLFFSVLRPRAGRFWTTKVAKQTKENFCKKHLFCGIFFESYYDCIGFVMLSINLVIIFYFTLCLEFLLSINELDQIFVKFDIHTTCRDSFVFLQLVCFSPWLAGRFHNFELTQNREKTRNDLTC